MSITKWLASLISPRPKHAKNVGIVPEGGQLKTYGPWNGLPGFFTSEDGVYTASLGVFTDRSRDIFERVLAHVAETFRKGAPSKATWLTKPMTTPECFSGELSTVQATALLWFLNTESFHSEGGLRRLQRLVDVAVELREGNHIVNKFFLTDPSSLLGAPIAQAISAAGFEVRKIEASEPFLIAVYRPDGKRVVALCGAPVTEQVEASPFRAICDEKRIATMRGDSTGVHDLEIQQLLFLSEHLGSGPPEPLHFELAAGIRETLLAVRAGRDGAREDLLSAMSDMDARFFFALNPEDLEQRTMYVMQWSENQIGIELYPDRRAARIAMQELKMDVSKHPLASSPNTDLYKSLVDQNLGASIWIDAALGDGGNSGFGVYVTPAELAALARGESSNGDTTNTH